MLTIAYYFLQVILCSGMMMGYYWLVLRNKRFHQYNRFYLLAIALLSWIVPLIKIKWSHPEVSQDAEPQVMQFLSVVADKNSQIEQTISTSKSFEWNWSILATGIYVLIAAILLFGMLRALFRLYRLLQIHSCKNVGDVYLILTQAKGTPFSFFRYIFWNEEIDIRSEAGKQILQHELTHVQQKHSFDKLFIQVMLIGGWFNPFFWLLRKEMDMIHEFIADKKAVNNGDTASLAQMLLTAAYPQQQFLLTHPFFFSPIKRRLKMLTNNKNPRFSYIRRLVVLPLLAIVIVLFAFRNKERRENNEISMATVMENVVKDQKQLTEIFLEGFNNYFETKNTNNPIHSIFYNGKALTVPTSLRLKDLNRIMFVPEMKDLDKNHQNLVPTLTLSSMANQPDPLYVIDGIKQSNKTSFNALNADDIESVNVWKGPDAIAKYGDTGKDGVIEIITKTFAANKKNADGFMGLVYEGIAKDLTDTIIKNRESSSLNKKDSVIGFGSKEVPPLILIDGLVSKDGLNKIDLDDINTINIWKDEKAIQQYGEAARNGVIEIATKSNSQFLKNRNGNIIWGDTVITAETIKRDEPYITAEGVPILKDGKRMPVTNATAPYANVFRLSSKTNNPYRIVREGFPAYDETTISNLGNRFADVKAATVNQKTKMLSIEFKNGSVESYNMSDPESRKIAEEKYKFHYIDKDIADNPQPADPQTDKVYTEVQIEPEFPGGKIAWQKYLDRNINKNIIAEKGGPPGKYTVVVSFIIDTYGNVSDVKALNDPGYGSKDEAIRVITKGPKWKPAVQNGRNVVARLNKSITFVVAENNARPVTTNAGKAVVTSTSAPAGFPGGLAVWSKYLMRNLQVEIPKKNGAPPGKYTVVLSFDIAADGIVNNVHAENDPGYGTKEEAIRIIAKGPKWMPAYLDGKFISSTYRQSITFLITQNGLAMSEQVFNMPPPVGKLTEKKQYYYFVDSRPRPGTNTARKPGVLYSDVKTVFGDEADISILSKKWADLVHSQCINTSGCTSDLNYYTSYADAKKQLDNVLRSYADTALYDCKKINASAIIRAKLDIDKYEPK